MPKLKNHLPSRARNLKSLCALGQDLHAPGMRARLKVEPCHLGLVSHWFMTYVLKNSSHFPSVANPYFSCSPRGNSETVSSQDELTHWGRVTQICVNILANIVSDNGLSPGRRQAIIWTSAGMLLIGPSGTNFNEIFIKIHTFSFKKLHLKTLSAKRRPFCPGLNGLTPWPPRDAVVNLTHWGRDKMGTSFLMTFSNALSWMKICKFRSKFHWSLFPMVQLTIFQHWFRFGLAPARRQAIIWTNDG